MLIKIKRGWELPERLATPESVFLDRRRLLKTLAAGPIVLGVPGLLAGCDEAPERTAGAADPGRDLRAKQLAAAGASDAADPSARLYPVQRNLRYRLDRALTLENPLASSCACRITSKPNKSVSTSAIGGAT